MIKVMELVLNARGKLGRLLYYPSSQPYVVDEDGIAQSVRRGDLFRSVMTFLLGKQNPGDIVCEGITLEYKTPEGEIITGDLYCEEDPEGGRIVKWLGNGLPPAPEQLVGAAKRLKGAAIVPPLALTKSSQ